MSGSVRTCCVEKCGRARSHSEGTALHSFPHPEKEKERFLTWINAVGSSISGLPYEYIYKNRKICDFGIMDFGTTQHNDYQWPFAKPVVGRPCEPPSPNITPPPRPPPVTPYCHCDSHSYSPREEQYKQLLEKEQKLCQDYEQLRRQMVSVTNDILDHPCDDLDSKMLTMYQSTYKKRSFPITDYRQIMAAAQSTAPIPMEPHRLGMLRCYKDPTNFGEKPPVVRPTIHPPGPIHTGVSPHGLTRWFSDYPGRTEYMDTYSASAKACWRSMQRYKEPLPSTRRRADDQCM